MLRCCSLGVRAVRVSSSNGVAASAGGVVVVRFGSTLPHHMVLHMPALSPTMESGNIARWNKAVGDRVVAGDVIADIETDKATLEWESTEEGVLAKILRQAPAVNVKVGAPIAVLCDSSEDCSAFQDVPESDFLEKSKSKGKSTQTKPPTASTTSTPPANTSTPTSPTPKPAPQKPLHISPAAHAIMRSNPNLDFTGAAPTGPRRTLLKGDVLSVLAGGAPRVQQPTQAQAQTQVQANTAPAHTAQPAAPFVAASSGFAPSDKSQIPHFYLQMDCNVENACHIADASKDIELLDIVVAAAMRSLKDIPTANATFTPTSTLQHSLPHVATLATTSDGVSTLISIDGGQNSSVAAVAATRKHLMAEAAKSKSPFNQGTSGVVVVTPSDHATPIPSVLPSRTLALGVGPVESRVVVQNGEIASARVVSLALGCDHRVVDGVLGARYLGSVKKYLEDPVLLLAL